MSDHAEWDLAIARRREREGWAKVLRWVRCECGKRRFVVPSPGWPTHCGRAMQVEPREVGDDLPRR